MQDWPALSYNQGTMSFDQYRQDPDGFRQHYQQPKKPNYTGWIIGCCYTRWVALAGTALLLPAVVPAAAMEFLVTPGFAGVNIDVIASWRPHPHPVVTIVAGGALLAASVYVAHRLTRGAPVR